MDGLVPSMPTSRAARPSAPRGVIVLAASNCPWDLDAALRRRLVSVRCVVKQVTDGSDWIPRSDPLISRVDSRTQKVTGEREV
jgi:hypothetical protein